jgi:hypothetical protein
MELLTQIFTFIVGALGGSLVTWQVMKKNIAASHGSTVVDQSGAQAGRDIVGGDKNKS